MDSTLMSLCLMVLNNLFADLVENIWLLIMLGRLYGPFPQSRMILAALLAGVTLGVGVSLVLGWGWLPGITMGLSIGLSAIQESGFQFGYVSSPRGILGEGL